MQGIEDPHMAEAYDRISRMPQFALFRRNFVKKLKKHAAGGSITDVGCGPGYLLQLIAKEFPTYKLTGVDISEEMVKTATANFSRIGLSGRSEFKQGSAEHLPFEDNTQDFIVSTLSLHHWVDPKAAFDEMHRSLKPGGQMLIMDLRRDARRLFFWLVWFAQNVALRIVGAGVIRRVNEPIGSLLASYTCAEIEEIMPRTHFDDYKIEGTTALVYLWARKKPIEQQVRDESCKA
jgi:ubiquinone/menaquinone biosynthesis C-methylase UbiE